MIYRVGLIATLLLGSCLWQGSVQKVWASADEACPSVASTAKINAPVDIKTLEEDAADGDVDAALNLAQEYTLTKDVKAAEKWYRFTLYKGDGRGSLGLYDLHKSGLLKLDDAENVRQYGLNLIEEDARKGNGGSAITLGRFALYGENRPRNADEARDWFTLAEKAGKPMASYFLGLMYSNGLDYDSLPRVAFHYFEKAAAAGIAPATRQVAIAYHTGIGAEKNLESAIICYTRSAEQGDMLAMRDLGNIYRYDHPNVALSESWYLKAAALGDLDSHYILGQMYQNTRPDESRRHMESAAKLKHHLARVAVDPTYVPHE